MSLEISGHTWEVKVLCVLSSHVQLFGHSRCGVGLIKAVLLLNESSGGTEGQGK